MKKTAAELNAEGIEHHKRFGGFVVFLYPSQVWMAVHEQVPFMTYAGMKYEWMKQ